MKNLICYSFFFHIEISELVKEIHSFGNNSYVAFALKVLTAYERDDYVEMIEMYRMASGELRYIKFVMGLFIGKIREIASKKS